jgi:hypothetical protein
MKTTITEYSKDFTSACFFGVKTATTGLAGGDSGHGGRLSLKIHFGECYAGKVEIKETASTTDLSIVVGGDIEMEQFIEGLKHAYETLSAKFPREGAYSSSATETTIKHINTPDLN